MSCILLQYTLVSFIFHPHPFYAAYIQFVQQRFISSLLVGCLYSGAPHMLFHFHFWFSAYFPSLTAPDLRRVFWFEILYGKETPSISHSIALWNSLNSFKSFPLCKSSTLIFIGRSDLKICLWKNIWKFAESKIFRQSFTFTGYYTAIQHYSLHLAVMVEYVHTSAMVLFVPEFQMLQSGSNRKRCRNICSNRERKQHYSRDPILSLYSVS